MKLIYPNLFIPIIIKNENENENENENMETRKN
jgi:hypothetical protein